MAEGQAPAAAAAAKKPALSNRLMQMKFMQRGKEKAVLKDAVAEQARGLFSIAVGFNCSKCAQMGFAVYC